jgi:hypothetical protein
MRCSPSGLRGVAAGVAAIALVATTAARAEAPPIRIEYQAHAGCPGVPVLIDEIARRTPLARFAAPSERATEVQARITARGGESRGHLTVGAGSHRVVREIASAGCDEIVSAFALIIALAVDPRASTTPRPPPALPPPTPAPAPPAPPAPPPTVTPPGRARWPGAALPPADILSSPLPVLLTRVPDRPAPPPGFWIVGGRASSTFAVTPRPLLGGGIFVERAFDAAARASLRLAVDLAATGELDIGPAGASFWQAALRLEGCVFGQRPLSRLNLSPCLRAEGGALGGAGILRGGLTHVQKTTVPWFGLGIAPRLSVDLARVVVEVEGGPTFPLVRRSFRFDSPDYLIHDVPPVVWSVSLGAGVRFP